MTTPEWLKPGIYGALIGAAALGIIGFTWGGWVTDGTSQERAEEMAAAELTTAMVPVCLEQARRDPQLRSKLETIRATSSYRQRDAVMDAGWATMPGTESPDRDIAQACLAELDLSAPTSPAVDNG